MPYNCPPPTPDFAPVSLTRSTSTLLLGVVVPAVEDSFRHVPLEVTLYVFRFPPKLNTAKHQIHHSTAIR